MKKKTIWKKRCGSLLAGALLTGAVALGGMAGDPQLFGCQNAGKGTPAGGGVVGSFGGVIIGFGICAGVICFQFCESNPQGGILEIRSCDGIHPDGVRCFHTHEP